MEVSGQLHAPATSPLGYSAFSFRWIGVWVGHRARLDMMKKLKIFVLTTDWMPVH